MYEWAFSIDGEEGRALAENDAMQEIALLFATARRGNDNVDVSSLRKDREFVQW
jgi:hypothetical protein